NFPHVSLGFIGVMSILCTWLSLPIVIDALLVTRIVVQFIGQIGALIWLRSNAPQMERPFRVWLYPLPALIALAGWVFLLATTGRKTLLYGGLAVALGVGAYFATAWKSRRWPWGMAKTAQ